MRLLLCITPVILFIGLTLEGARGQETNATTDEADLSDSQQIAHQLASLNTGHEQLKVRLGMMEQHFGEQEKGYNEIEQKFEKFEKKLDMLQDHQMEELEKHNKEVKDTLGSVRSKECHRVQSEVPVIDENTKLLSEFQKVNQQQEGILTKLDGKCPAMGFASPSHIQPVHVEGTNVCWGIYDKILRELNSNRTILQNIDRNLANINDVYTAEIAQHKKSLEVEHGVLKFVNVKGDAKICKGSNDQMLMCTEEPHLTSCADYDSKHCSDHKCHIKNTLYGPDSFVVACDDSTDGGGWTVIQRRLNGSVDFYRGWDEYKTGFGNIDGEFWIGLDKLYALTTSLAPVELLIQLRAHDDILKYAKYSKFVIGDETELYELKEAEDYEGDAGDSFSPHKGLKFSTKDKDNDMFDNYNCAEGRTGAWWYGSCQWSNLNGFYYKTGNVPKNEKGRGINWGTFNGYNYSLKFVQMMIRPKKNT